MRIFAQKITETAKSSLANNSKIKTETGDGTPSASIVQSTRLNNIVSFEKFREPEKKAIFSIPLFEENETEDKGPKKKKDFDDIWTLYRDAENTAPDVHTVEQLRTKIGADSNWKLSEPIKMVFRDRTHANNIGGLVKTLEKHKLATPQILSDMAKIADHHGMRVLELISGDLDNYLSSYSSPGEKHKQVVINALHDIAYPSDIDQKGKDTCTGASTQMKTALEKPVMYVEMLTSLAKNKDYTLPSGKKVEANNTWVGDKTDSRNYSARILQNAFVELGNDDFDSTGGEDKSGNHGLTKSEQRYVLEKVFNNSDIDNDEKGFFNDGEDLYQYLEDDIARGRAVQASFDGHSVLVVGIDKSKGEPKVIINSWGSQYSMTVAEFKKYVVGVRSVDDSGSDNRKISGSKVILGDK